LPFELSGSISKESSIFLLPPFPNQISESCPSLLPLIEFVLPLELFVFSVLALQLFPLLFSELTFEFGVSFFFLLSFKRSERNSGINSDHKKKYVFASLIYYRKSVEYREIVVIQIKDSLSSEQE